MKLWAEGCSGGPGPMTGFTHESMEQLPCCVRPLSFSDAIPSLSLDIDYFFHGISYCGFPSARVAGDAFRAPLLVAVCASIWRSDCLGHAACRFGGVLSYIHAMSGPRKWDEKAETVDFSPLMRPSKNNARPPSARLPRQNGCRNHLPAKPQDKIVVTRDLANDPWLPSPMPAVGREFSQAWW